MSRRQVMLGLTSGAMLTGTRWYDMSRLLGEIDRHSSKLLKLAAAITVLENQQSQQVAQSKAILNYAKGSNRLSSRLRALGLLGLFVAGVAFGGYILS